MGSITRLRQQGYKSVATFTHRERAEQQAAYMKRLGHKATVIKAYNNFGDEVYVVYFKAKEV